MRPMQEHRDPTPEELVSAVRAVHATSAEVASEGDLVSLVNKHMRAIDHCEEALQRIFSTRELERLTGILVDMHRDPLGGDDQSLDAFVDEL